MATVLVVDDNRNIRDFCRRELEKDGYRVLVAASGEEAVRICDADSPDLVVLDIRMPGQDGLETMGRIARRHPLLPVVFFTAHPADLHFDFRSWPARACVEKSENLGALKAKIAEILNDV